MNIKSDLFKSQQILFNGNHQHLIIVRNAQSIEHEDIYMPYVSLAAFLFHTNVFYYINFYIFNYKTHF